jgi:hypothetical protein
VVVRQCRLFRKGSSVCCQIFGQLFGCCIDRVADWHPAAGITAATAEESCTITKRDITNPATFQSKVTANKEAPPGRVCLWQRGYGFSFAGGRCKLPLMTRQAAGNSSPRFKKMAVGARTDIASALWYRGPGQVEIRREEMAPPGAGEVRVKAIYSAISRGTESLVFGGTYPSANSRECARRSWRVIFPFP